MEEENQGVAGKCRLAWKTAVKLKLMLMIFVHDKSGIRCQKMMLLVMSAPMTSYDITNWKLVQK